MIICSCIHLRIYNVYICTHAHTQTKPYVRDLSNQSSSAPIRRSSIIFLSTGKT